jgi:hypothetical protein
MVVYYSVSDMCMHSCPAAQTFVGIEKLLILVYQVFLGHCVLNQKR